MEKNTEGFCKNCHALLRPVKNRDGSISYICPRCKRNIERTGESDDLFPFEKLRPIQSEFLRDAREALAGKKIMMANAPTGLGKTAVALTATVEYGLKNGCIVFFMTSRQSQHKIAIETLARMRKKTNKIVVADMIGKKSMCIADNIKNSRFFEELCAASYRTHVCKFAHASPEIVRKAKEKPMDADEIIKLGIAQKSCPYMCATDVGKDATVVVCDYNYIFSDLSEIVLQKLGVDIENLVLVVDEAHNLPERIRANYTQILRPEDFKEASGMISKIDPMVAGILNRMYGKLTQHNFQDEEKLDRGFFEEIYRSVSAENLAALSFTDFLEKLEMLNAFLEKQGIFEPWLENIGKFIKRWNTNEDAFLRFAKEGKFICESLDTSTVGRKVFEKCSAGLIMSATLHPLEMYRDLLGVPEERCMYKYYMSPFPKENRLLLTVRHLTSRYSARNKEMYESYSASITEIIKNVPGNVAVFYTSYQMMAEIGNRITEMCKKLHIFEQSGMTKSQKISVLNELRENRDRGAVLHAVLGGSLSEGIDFRDNLLSCVIIVGIPVSPPNVETVSLENFLKQKYGDEKGYAYARICPAFNKVLQAAGRCIRSEKDRGVIILMDARFNYPGYRKYLPEDFIPENVTDIRSAMARFFGSMQGKER